MRPLFFSVLVAIAAGASTAKADLIKNGTFESGSFLLPNSQQGWTATNIESPWSAVRGYNTGYGSIHPHGGSFYASLSNDRTGGTIPGHGQAAEISQTIATTVGTNYVLSFWTYIEAAPSYPKPPGLVFQAYWDNSLKLDISNPQRSPRNWVQHIYTVKGTGNDTLQFFGANDPRYNGLDDVSLLEAPPPTHTPLPGNLTMCSIAAVLGLGLYRFRRWRHATPKFPSSPAIATSNWVNYHFSVSGADRGT